MKRNNKEKPQGNKIIINETSNFFYKINGKEVSTSNNDNLPLEKNNTGSILFIDEKKLNSYIFEEDNSTIENSDIENLIETKLLKETQFLKEGMEAGLEYNFFYKKRTSINDSRKSRILVYAIPKGFIQEEYSQIAQDIDYINYITPASLLPEILYEKEILEKDKVDIFIYFGNNTSFISIFIDGMYIYSKDLPITLEDIYQNLAKKLKQKITFEEFSVLLIERGFNVETYDGDDMNILDILINDVFHDTFNKINQIITSARRMLNIEKVDRVYIGTEVGSIPDMKEYAKEKLMNTETLDFSFTESTSLDIEKKGKINPLIELSDILLSSDSKTAILNFTEFKPPLPFFKRPTAKPISIILAGIIFIILFVLSQTFYIELLKGDIKGLEKENASFKVSLAETEAYKKKVLGEKKNLIDEEKKLKIDLANEIEKLKKQKIQISTNESKTRYIINIFKDLTRNGLILKSFKMNNGNKINLTINTKKHLNIGNFVNTVLDTKLYKVKMSVIKLEPKTGLYETTITLERIN